MPSSPIAPTWSGCCGPRILLSSILIRRGGRSGRSWVLLLLVAITVLAIRGAKKHPYAAVGWIWYVGTLVPVIGIVQVGSQAMADRYTYIPLVGLFIIVAWAVPELLEEMALSKGGPQRLVGGVPPVPLPRHLETGRVLAKQHRLVWSRPGSYRC